MFLDKKYAIKLNNKLIKKRARLIHFSVRAQLMFAYLFLHIPIAFNTTSAPTSAAISTRSAVGWERGVGAKRS